MQNWALGSALRPWTHYAQPQLVSATIRFGNNGYTAYLLLVSGHPEQALVVGALAQRGRQRAHDAGHTTPGLFPKDHVFAHECLQRYAEY